MTAKSQAETDQTCLADAIKDLDPKADAIDLVAALEESVGGLVLIFDQFEELLLHAKPADVTAALDLISALVEQHRSTRGSPFIVVSLRSEALPRVTRLLGQQISEFHRYNVLELQPLPTTSVLDVFRDSAQEAPDVDLDPAVLAEIESWLDAAAKADELSRRDASESSTDAEESAWRKGAVDLQALNTFMRELYWLARGGRRNAESREEDGGPWPGARPYAEDRRRVFFGRTAEVRDILKTLFLRGLVVLHAYSGVGKTSLLRAGVVATLKDRRQRAADANDLSKAPAVLVVRDWVTRDTRDPVAAAIREAAMKSPAAGRALAQPLVRISTSTIDLCVATELERLGLPPEQAAEIRSSHLLASALERYLDTDVLPRPRGLMTLGGTSSPIVTPNGIFAALVPGASGRALARPALTAEDWRKVANRRAAARIASHLSTGGLKIQQPEYALLRHAWALEFSVLGIKPDSVAGAVRKIARGQATGGFAAAIDPAPKNLNDRPRVELSGYAWRKGWTKAEAIDQLHEMLGSAILALKDGNVVRPKDSPAGPVHELVHDGWGDTFIRWAERQQTTPLDALAAITAIGGVTLEWERLEGRVDAAVWLGCWVGPPEDRVLEVDTVDFTECDFRGTVFSGCRFKDVRFDRTNLNGVVFENCTFEGVTFKDCDQADGIAFYGGKILGGIFENCDLLNMTLTTSDTTTAGTSLTGVTFTDCIVEQMNVNKATLDGEVTFDDCWLGLGDLSGFGGQDRIPAFKACRIIYCRVDDAGLRAAMSDNQVHEAPGALPNWAYRGPEGSPRSPWDAVPQEGAL